MKVEAVLGLFADGRRRAALGSAGRRYVEEHHRWDRCLEPLGPLLGLPGTASPREPAEAPAARVI
jgi:hypothetical protein